MRSLLSLPSLNSLLLLHTFVALSSIVNASSHDTPRPIVPPPLGVSRPLSYNVNGRSWLSRVRDEVIESIWRIPAYQVSRKIDCKSSAGSGPPSTLVARYGGDLVLRFEIKSIEESEALARAINVLFLDVWEFTMEWVDIRLSKDVVGAI